MGDNTPPETFSMPFATAFFGGYRNPDPSTLTQVVAYTFDSDLLTGLEFLHTDSAHDVLLGRRGPFGDDFPKNRCNMPSEDRRMPFSIDGPGGERITGIQVEVSCRDIQGLKVGVLASLLATNDTANIWLCRLRLILAECIRPTPIPILEKNGFTFDRLALHLSAYLQ